GRRTDRGWLRAREAAQDRWHPRGRAGAHLARRARWGGAAGPGPERGPGAPTAAAGVALALVPARDRAGPGWCAGTEPAAPRSRGGDGVAAGAHVERTCHRGGGAGAFVGGVRERGPDG